MGRKTKFTAEIKIDAVKNYLSGTRSQNQIAKDLNIHISTIQGWISSYKTLGTLGVTTTSKNAGYSEQLKKEAVIDYLSGNFSQYEVCEKYGIRNRTQLRKWILQYNDYEKIKSSGTGGISIMIKGRTTTFEERIEIVKYCIEHNRNYNETAEAYKVSYQQVRSWTVKYEQSGVDALVDRRGKHKSEDELTEFDRLKAQNKLLEARYKRLEMENELLKKLEEMERGHF
ncbi:transposase IS3/IS911 family protein [Clostridium aceticum]|uniref:Transposase n=1 Tax=Clostridium aceticum TaxID=84022 RepID=A0A0D8I847_9CLOT|nr:helix-turn-helix domain-containing protein [Clostridium aceticum]AKL94349.1 transposase [Clostridium aceticum]AKL95857.1 transposase IS3/IS911 family protein [Clostridium aceticum]KJF25391.1 transposase [Clostridium aceticum]